MKTLGHVVAFLRARAVELRQQADAQMRPLASLDRKQLTERQWQIVNSADAKWLASQEIDQLIAEIEAEICSSTS
jgi:hypothetical protein